MTTHSFADMQQRKKRFGFDPKSVCIVGLRAVFRHTQLQASFVGRDAGSRRRTRQVTNERERPRRRNLKKADRFGMICLKASREKVMPCTWQSITSHLRFKARSSIRRLRSPRRHYAYESSWERFLCWMPRLPRSFCCGSSPLCEQSRY